MITSRYVLPAGIAAALHAALLFAYPEISGPTFILHPPRQETPPRPPVAIEPVDPPDPTDEPAPVEALQEPGEPVPFTVDRSMPDPDSWLPRPPDATERIRPDRPVTTLPRQVGPGGGPAFGPATDGRTFIGHQLLDRPPRTRAQPPPDYPFALRRDGIEGTVLVEFDVDAEGRVVAARVRQSAHREFDAAAIKAVLRWRFEPGKRDGRAVPFRMTVPIGFSLSEN